MQQFYLRQCANSGYWRRPPLPGPPVAVIGARLLDWPATPLETDGR
jgi:hypothetical protein